MTIINNAWCGVEPSRKYKTNWCAVDGKALDVKLPKPFGAQNMKVEFQTLNIEIHFWTGTWVSFNLIVIVSWSFLSRNRKHVILIISLEFL